MIDITNTFFAVKSENDCYVIFPKTTTGTDKWFTELSYTLAFSDCSDEAVILITYHGKRLHYVGWQPNMLYEFADEEGNIVWSHSFPQWDH